MNIMAVLVLSLYYDFKTVGFLCILSLFTVKTIYFLICWCRCFSFIIECVHWISILN